MEYVVIGVVALGASALTLVSGFGLGTLLLPAFAIFFPIELSVAMTAGVHFANNVFKLGLVGRHAVGSVVLRFGLPALVCAFGGAFLLVWLSDFPPVFEYSLAGHSRSIRLEKTLIGGAMMAFALLESRPMVFGNHLFLGGVVSGFFGGLSGHQGALRSAFLVRLGMSNEAFIGTGVVIACLVDVARMTMYGMHMARTGWEVHTPLMITASLAAFAGAFVASKFIKKMTMDHIRKIVTGMLLVIGGLLAGGLM